MPGTERSGEYTGVYRFIMTEVTGVMRRARGGNRLTVVMVSNAAMMTSSAIYCFYLDCGS